LIAPEVEVGRMRRRLAAEVDQGIALYLVNAEDRLIGCSGVFPMVTAGHFEAGMMVIEKVVRTTYRAQHPEHPGLGLTLAACRTAYHIAHEPTSAEVYSAAAKNNVSSIRNLKDMQFEEFEETDKKYIFRLRQVDYHRMLKVWARMLRDGEVPFEGGSDVLKLICNAEFIEELIQYLLQKNEEKDPTHSS
jgi:hypothetical protein